MGYAALQQKDTTMNFRTMMQSGPAKANELFSRLAETSDGAVKTRERLFTELKAELELHTSLEEQHLFPILRKNADSKELVVEAIRDNKELRAKLGELDAMAKNDPAFAEQLAELQKSFRQHARDEKKELLPAVQRALSEEQVQNVAEKMEASLAEVEQAKEAEAEERRAKAKQDREDAEFAARQAELRDQKAAAAKKERAEADARASADARRIADAAVAPVVAATKAAVAPVIAATKAAEKVTGLVTGADAQRRAQAQTKALTSMFLWPWAGAMQTTQPAAKTAPARGPQAMEEVIQLGEEVLEIGKRTENRGTARIRRFVVETPVEQQVTLVSEKVVVERRRPVSDKVTGEILTEVTIEIIETEEVPTVEKRTRLREEMVVRMERTERVETVRGMVRRDDVEIQEPERKRGNRQTRAVTAEG